MKNKRIIIFIFPIFLAMVSIPALFGYYTFDKYSENIVTHRFKKLVTELDQVDGPLSKEHKEYIVASLKAGDSEVQLLGHELQILIKNYKDLVKSILIVLCIQIVSAVYLVKHVQFTKHQL